MWSVRVRNRRDRRSRIDRRIIFLTLGLGLFPALISPALGAEPRMQASPAGGGHGAPAMNMSGGHGGAQPGARAGGGHQGRPPGGGHQGRSPGGGHQGRPPGGGHQGRPPGGHGGYGGHGGHGGSYGHNGYYRPYYGYGYGSAWNSSIYWGLGGYWPGWYGYGYGYPYYAPGAAVYSGGGPQGGVGAGALDLDVSPERAAVYIDGQSVGVCDDYDGFPNYLWLEPGTYDLVIYLPGYRTIARQVTLEAGVMVDVADRMEPGEAVRPEDLASKSTVRRDERMRQDRERLGEMSARAAAQEREAESGALDLRGEPGRLQLQVEPKDASVYLDGRFLGTGEELARLHAGLLIDPGQHRLEIVRPGYQSVERSFDATAGTEVELSVSLESN